jgi:hypothetical protein
LLELRNERHHQPQCYRVSAGCGLVIFWLTDAQGQVLLVVSTKYCFATSALVLFLPRVCWLLPQLLAD